MRINYSESTIELTKAEAKAAGVYGSEAYTDLVSARHDFPGFDVVTIKRKSKHTDGLKGLTFDYMAAYIEKKGSDEQAAAFQALRGADDGLGHTSPAYGEVKKWFLEEFPEILEYRKKIDSILNHAVA